MKEYKKPYIEDEKIEIEDVIAISGLGSVFVDGNDTGIVEDAPGSLW